MARLATLSTANLSTAPNSKTTQLTTHRPQPPAVPLPGESGILPYPPFPTRRDATTLPDSGRGETE